MLAACGSKGGGASAGSPSHAIDSSPHEYTFRIFSGDTEVATVHFHLVCNFGLPDAHDVTDDMSINNGGGTVAGVSCGGPTSNATIEVTSTIATNDPVLFNVDIDGVQHPELEHDLVTGQSYTFQRGF